MSVVADTRGPLAFNEFFYGWNFIAAEREFGRALELDPKWAPASGIAPRPSDTWGGRTGNGART